MSELAPQRNIASIALRSMVAQIPILGAVINEVLTETLPNLKIQRIEHLLEELEARVRSVEDGRVSRKLTQPVFADLLEDAMRSASRSTSRLRQEHIAALVSNGLKDDAERALSSRYLLGLLDQLNDAELLMLIGFGMAGGAYDAFFRKHAQTLSAPFVPYVGGEDAESDSAAIFDDYQHHLERLRLVMPAQPSAGAQWGDRPTRREITDLGKALLRAIDQLQQHCAPSAEAVAFTPEDARRFWSEFVPVLASRANWLRERVTRIGHQIQFSSRDINMSATLVGASRRDVRLSGFIDPNKGTIWIEVSGGSRPTKLLIRLGSDLDGVYWEHDGKRRTDREQLADLVLTQLLIAADLNIS